MSHAEAHVWGPWSTEVETNAAGETQTILVRYCFVPRCGAKDLERGAVIEMREPYTYAKTLDAGSEPDD